MRHRIMLRSTAPRPGPTMPTGLAGTATAGGVLWSWDASADEHDGSIAASGVKEYDIEADGVVTVQSSATTNILTLPTVSSIGGAPMTMTQSGNVRTLVTSGTGIDGTSDQCGFVSWPVNGDFKLTCKVASFNGTGAFEYAPAGLMVRDSTAPGSRYIALYQWFSALSMGWQSKWRDTTDGPRQSGLYVAGDNGAVWLQIERSSDTFVFRWSRDSTDWQVLETKTMAMNAGVNVGAFASDLQASPVTVTAVIDQLSYTVGSRLSYTQVTSNATASVRVRARDNALIAATSAYTPLLTRSGAGLAMSWNPGYYVRSDSQPFSENLSSHLSELDTIHADVGANIQGVAMPFPWGDLERAKDDYSAGFAMIDAYLARCVTLGYRLLIQLKTRRFGGASVPAAPQTAMRSVPDYLLTETDPNVGGALVYVCSDGGGEGVALHRQYVMDRLLLLIQALGNRYNSHPNVEAFEFGELSYSMANDSAQWGKTNYLNQMNRLCDAIRTYWPNKTAAPGINFVWGEGDTETYAIRSMNLGNAMSGPDAITSTTPAGNPWAYGASWGALVMRGYHWNGSAWVSGVNPDRYLEVASKYEMQVVPDNALTAANYADHAADALKCTHFVYSRFPGYGPVGCQWSAVANYLNATATRRAMRSAFPTKYTDAGYTPITGGS